MTLKKFSSVFLTVAMFIVLTFAQADADYKTKLKLSIAASGPVYDEAYILTVPEDLTITQPGWNALGNITVRRSADMTTSFDVSKKLVVTATSTHKTGDSFYLASTTQGVTDTITYDLMSGDSEATATKATTFEFTAAEINKTGGTSKPIGVNVEDYKTNNKAAGEYEDEITYEVSVESAVTTKTVTWNDLNGASGNTLTKDGVTLTAGTIDTANKDISGGGTFSVASGNFTKIEVTAYDVDGLSGDGWSKGNMKQTWTGKAASVSFSGNIDNMGSGVFQIVFTIEE